MYSPSTHLAQLLDVAWAEQSEAREPVPSAHDSKALRNDIIEDAVKPLHDPKLRELLAEIKKNNEITINHVSAGEVLEATFSKDVLDRAKGMVQSFEQLVRFAIHQDNELIAFPIRELMTPSEPTRCFPYPAPSTCVVAKCRQCTHGLSNPNPTGVTDIAVQPLRASSLSDCEAR